jgi:6-phosphogluconolactonase
MAAPSVEVYPNGEQLAQAAAERIAAIARRACALRGEFTWLLAGGRTPRRAYARLAEPPLANNIDWRGVQVFWGDERCAPPDHVDSNYRLAWESLLSRVPIPTENIHRIAGELPPEEAAQAYHRLLEDRLRAGADLALLGIGEDGHTASLFAGDPALQETVKKAMWVAHSQQQPPLIARVTVTLPLLNAARQVIFLVSGAGKAEMVRRAVHPQASEVDIPAGMIIPTRGEVLWMLDRAAGEQLGGL